MEEVIVARTGNEAVAEAMRQINPDVVAAYPITPATEIVQIFSNFVADGLVKTEYIAVESEHSAMSACIGAAAAGARVMTGTSSQGLAYMAEMLPIAAGLRLPIIMCDVNRALSAPINIHCDHSDTMFVRDAGWIQIFSENAQEAYDNMLQAVKIAEAASLPVMVTMDGFIISHGMESVRIATDDEVRGYVGRRTADISLLDVEHPVAYGALDFTDFYFEHRRALADAMEKAKTVIITEGEAFAKLFGRHYGLLNRYKTDDAETILVALGSTAGTASVVVDQLRDEGVKAGLVKLRVFRPFPGHELTQAVKLSKNVAVLDRSDSLSGMGGPLYAEVRSALFELEPRPKVSGFIYGLGGREISTDQIREIFDLASRSRSGTVSYIGVRE